MASKRSSEGQRRVSARAKGMQRTKGGEAGPRAAKVARPAAVKAARPAAAKKARGVVATADAAVGSEAEYERFLEAARALPKDDVERLAVDPAVAYHNVKAGVEAVLAHEAVVRKLPGIDVRELRALPGLSLGLSFATLQVDRDERSDGQTRVLLGKAALLRRTLMTGADALAAAGLLPAAAVAKIREGRGPLDLADDCVALAALFRKHAPALRGKTAVTAADLKYAAELGTELRTRLKPGRARRTGARPGESEAELRDRFWTLLVRGHDKLWRAGAFVFGRREVDARVPPLGSHAAGKRGSKELAGGEEKLGAGRSIGQRPGGVLDASVGAR